MRLRKRKPIKTFMMATLVFVGLLVLSSVAFAGEWRNHVSSMGGQQTKIRQLEGELHHLIEEKRHTTDSQQLQHIASEMTRVYAELVQVSKEYREEYLHVRFRHPEKGDESERQYSRYKLKTLKELEADVGLEGQLDRIKKKVQLVYGVHKPEPVAVEVKPSPEERKPAAVTKPPEDEERIRLTK